MTTDLDRIAQVNLADNIIRRLMTVPGGIADMRRVMRETRPGPSSASLEDSRSDRYETVIMPEGPTRVRVPSNDPTGERAIADDPAGEALAEFDELLHELEMVVRDLANLHDQWSPRGLRRGDDEAGPGEDWCVSCWRDNTHCEPVTLRKVGGSPYYAGRCKWCGDWRASHKNQDPPLAIIQARHRGERITSAMERRYTAKPARRSKGKQRRAS